jgi:hypothetical protein
MEKASGRKRSYGDNKNLRLQPRLKPKKPVDTWLGLFGVAAGIVFFLVPKHPVVIIVSVVLIFLLLFHPLWNFWWIERSTLRRMVALIVLVALLAVLGAWTWPKSSLISDEQLCSDARALGQRMRDFNRERWLQHDETNKQFGAMLEAAKTVEEKAKIEKERAESFHRWLVRRNYDWDTMFLPQAKYLRREIMSRLPPQPNDQLIVDELLFGTPAGHAAFQDTADRLEIWAKKLCS